MKHSDTQRGYVPTGWRAQSLSRALTEARLEREARQATAEKVRTMTVRVSFPNHVGDDNFTVMDDIAREVEYHELVPIKFQMVLPWRDYWYQGRTAP